jgi:hypothetical protein
MIAASMIFALNANAGLFGKSSNLITNGGFEEVRNNSPKDWRVKDQPLPEGITVEVSQDRPHSGKNCLLLNHTIMGDTMVIQNLKVTPEKCYMATVWIRTENVAQQPGSANLTLLYLDGAGGIEGILTAQEFSDTGNEWMKYELPFRARKTKTPLLFGVRFGGQGVANQGKVFYDDVEVKEIPDRDDAIGFYIPGGEPSSETPPASPFVPSKTLIFIVVGTLIVGFLVFLEFNLSQKEKKEQAEAEAKSEFDQVGQACDEQAVGEQAVDEQVADNVAEKKPEPIE